MNRRDVLIGMIEALHAEIAALRTNDIAALEAATAAKLRCIDAVAQPVDAAMTPELDALASEAMRLNETCRIYVNLMAANVRRRLQVLAGSDTPAYRPRSGAVYA